MKIKLLVLNTLIFAVVFLSGFSLFNVKNVMAACNSVTIQAVPSTYSTGQSIHLEITSSSSGSPFCDLFEIQQISGPSVMPATVYSPSGVQAWSYNTQSAPNGVYSFDVTAYESGSPAASDSSGNVNVGPIPNVDLKINDRFGNPQDGTVILDTNDTATLSWTSSNAASCASSGTWAITPSVPSGSYVTGQLSNGSKTYGITCDNGFGLTHSDTVFATVTTPATLSGNATTVCTGTPPAIPRIDLTWLAGGYNRFHLWNNTQVSGGPLIAFLNTNSYTVTNPQLINGYGANHNYQVLYANASDQVGGDSVQMSAVATCDATINVSTSGAPTTGTWSVVSNPAGETKSGTPMVVRPPTSGATYTITVTPPNGYSIRTSPAGLTSSQGGSTSTNSLAINLVPGQTGNFSVAYASGQPPNNPPNAGAGTDRNITLSTSSTTASGATASDPDGDAITIAWAYVSCSGTCGVTPSISSGTTLTPTFSGMTNTGVYTFRITVDDGSLSASDTMTVTVSSGGSPQPDLTIIPANDPIPTFVTVNTPTPFSSTMSNIGAASTGGGVFTNLFQFDNDSDHSTVTASQTVSAGPVAAGGTLGFSSTYTFTVVGFGYVRACADNNASFVGTITESNEGNNCSNWVQVQVDTVGGGVPTVPTGLTANPQACGTGQINLSWTAVSGATAYTLRDGATAISTSQAGTTFNHTGLTAGSSHSYTVRAQNTAGNSAYSSAVAANAPATCAASNPDLTAAVPTPAAATAGVPLTFTSNVSNIGTATTGASFNNFFQVATAASGGGALTSMSVNTLPTLAAGANANVTSSNYTFSYGVCSGGICSVRLCADNNASFVGTITESNEGNNCSPWRNVTVSSNIDFTADVPTLGNGSAVGIPQVFISKIWNMGTTSLTAMTAVPVRFQISTTPDISGILAVRDAVVAGMSAGAFSQALSATYTPSSPGTYYVRAAADFDSTWNSTIPETNENNNYSNWFSFVVAPGATPELSVDLTVRQAGIGSYVDGPITVPYNSLIDLRWTTQILNSGNTLFGCYVEDSAIPSFPNWSPGMDLGTAATGTRSNVGPLVGVTYEFMIRCTLYYPATDFYEDFYDSVQVLREASDLTAGAVSPAAAAVGVPTTFSGTVSNLGPGPTMTISAPFTGVFPNFFQLSNAANGAAAVFDAISTNNAGPLASGASSNVTSSPYSFPSVGAYSVRLCANTSTGFLPGSRAYEGVNDLNNCGPWTNVTVSVAQPNLTTAAATPNVAIQNQPQIFTARITNNGGASTGASFSYFGQRTGSAGGGGTLNNITPATSTGALPAGGFVDATFSYTFTGTGTKSVRICADATSGTASTISGGVITESDETVADNCGPWTNVTVSAAGNWTVTPSAGANGTISPNTVQTVANNATTTFSVTANAGYTASVGGTCGGAPASGTGTFTYTTSPVIANCTVVASFSQMSGTLLPAASSCTIAANASSCTSGTLTWTTTNPVGVSAVTNNGTATPASPSGNNSSSTFTVPYNDAMGGVTTFYLYNNALLLAQSTVTTTCIVGSAWNGTICLAATPNLTTAAATPNVAIQNQPQIFTARITNNGGASTGASFSYFGQRTGSAGGGGTLNNITPATSTGALPAGGFVDATFSYTFTGTGTKSVRICADATSGTASTISGGVITESDETVADNCGPWTNVTVSAAGSPMSGTLTPSATSCNIAVGASSCTIDFDWSVLNPVIVGGSAVTSDTDNSGAASPNFQVATGDTGNNVAFIIPYLNNGSHTARNFYLYNNAQLLDQESGTIIADCAPGNAWDGNSCESTALPPVIDTFIATPSSINVGESSTLSWTSSNTDYCMLTGNATQFLPNDSIIVSPIVTTTYELICFETSASLQSAPQYATVFVGAPPTRKPIYVEPQ